MLDLYKIDFYTITDEKGNVLARIPETDSFGDSVLNQRNIEDALTGKVSTYFEEGSVVKVSARTGSPVYSADGKLIGVISAGVRFDTESAVDYLKELFSCEAAVCYGGDTVVSTFNAGGQGGDEIAAGPEAIRTVFENRQEYSGDMKINGDVYKTYCKPLINADGEAFAVIFLGIPKSDLESENDNFISSAIGMGVGGLVISIVLLFFIISSISKPLINLADDMGNVADGNLNINISAKNNDEIGGLSRALQKVIDTINKLLKDINIMILEHENGNTEYCLDTSAFSGDYRVLAENILKLSVAGMKDQLTGLSNRRSFDSRIELEWNRAMRDRSPISILMLDVDDFKAYNDSYGHQQGDMALQTVANVLIRSTKRMVDFAARWGGEEFVVLLPQTDSAGAMIVAENIRKKIADATIQSADEAAARIRVSIGANTIVPTADSLLRDFITDTDKALYAAKGAGKNRICEYEPEPDEK